MRSIQVQERYPLPKNTTKISDKQEVPQAAALVYRRKKGAVEVLLVTSLATQRWVLPKGHLDDGTSPRKSAEREAFEEAGVKGVIASKSIGTYPYLKADTKGGGRRRVEVFPMKARRLLDDWPEKRLRTRKWMSLEDAAAAVEEEKLKKLIMGFRKNLS